jgi:formylmethanofuran dehydrogenase subunit E
MKPGAEKKAAGEDRDTIVCSMCRQRVPIARTRRISGRTLCFGCLESWYDDEET